VAPPNDPVTEVVVPDVELSIRPKTKKKRGKGKEKVKSTEVNVASNGTYEEDAFAPQLAESPEEVAERAKRKAERLERLRDDPYYLIDDKSSSQVPDVDAIPIVTLDGMSEPFNTPQLTSLMSLRAGSANKSYDVDREGEAPTISRLHSSQAIVESGAAPLTSVNYDTVADVSSTASPAPIQVTRVKKARGAGKKKTDTESARRSGYHSPMTLVRHSILS